MIEVGSISTREHFENALELQRKIWGFAEADLLPVRSFIVAKNIGGQVFGAFDGERMIGFCISMPGLKPGPKGYFHSQMLGVLPEYNNQGIGKTLKLAQREDALKRRIDLIEWTFDPFEIKNAFFNIEKLGAVIRRYAFNQYGTTSSFLHGGLPTDRCIAEWWIDSARVESALAGRPVNRPAIEATIEVPAAMAELRTTDVTRASEIQKAAGERFQKLFDMGLTVVGFDRSEEGGTYLLGFSK